MKLDSTQRLFLINEAIVHLLEQPGDSNFGQRRLKTEEPPETPWWAEGDPNASTHRVGWKRPSRDQFNPEARPGFVGPPDPNRDAGAEEANYKNAMRQYHLWNQRGLSNFNPKGKAQNYSPAWNVRGEARREQMRAYLNYIRSDPERLADFRSRTNTIGKVSTGSGRSEAQVQAMAANYEQGRRAARREQIGQFDPQAANALGRADAANRRAADSAQQWGEIESGIDKETDAIERARNQAKIDAFKRDRQLDKDTQSATDAESVKKADEESKASEDRINARFAGSPLRWLGRQTRPDFSLTPGGSSLVGTGTSFNMNPPNFVTSQSAGVKKAPSPENIAVQNNSFAISPEINKQLDLIKSKFANRNENN